MESPLIYFSNLTDPRMDRTREHSLEDILFIAIASVICGAESRNEMEAFGKAKEDWLRTFFRLPSGIPSHDTFNRLFSALNPRELETCFMNRTRSTASLCENEVIAGDGKSMRGTRKAGSKSIVHPVSAWAEQNHLVLGQVKVNEKSNEITAIPELLNLLVLKGCIVTIDTMGCQREIASKIVEKEANYILALKGNQGSLSEQAQDSFRFLPAASFDEQVDSGHGRVETRRCSLIEDLSVIENRRDWPEMQYDVNSQSGLSPANFLNEHQFRHKYFLH